MWGEKIQCLAYRVIQAAGAGIFLGLTYYSLRYSQYMFPQMREFPIDVRGITVYNILAAGILCFVVFVLMRSEAKLTERGKMWIEHIFLTASMCWAVGGGFWWVNSLNRIPVGDQAFVYGGACYFLEGQYSFLSPGGYCSMYPHQLGMIALLELLFFITGTCSYYTVEAINILLAGGIVLLGYGLMRELSTSFAARIFYCLFVAGCVPLICYTNWIYGDMPSIFFTMLTAWFVLRWHRCSRKQYLAGIVAAAVMAVLVRKNSLIFLIALFLLAVIYVIRYHRWQLLLTVVLAGACSFLVYQGIFKMYEVRSGYEHCDGFPANSWIMLGVLEQDGLCGWYNNLQKEVLYATDFDYEETEIIIAGFIRERLHVFIENPQYARWFYKNKILSQWNDPLYQSIYFSAKTLEQNSPEPGSFLDGLYNRPEVHDRVFRFADIMQFLVYFGMLLYYLFAVRKERQPLEYFLAVTIIGGFFFSILWEAKARYIFSYYVMMYPLAVTGYFEAIQRAIAFRQKIDESKQK